MSPTQLERTRNSFVNINPPNAYTRTYVIQPQHLKTHDYRVHMLFVLKTESVNPAQKLGSRRNTLHVI